MLLNDIFVAFMNDQIYVINEPQKNWQCPFCGHPVIDWTQEQYQQPCEHTLFIAMDLGFEFIADRFESYLKQDVDTLHEDTNSKIFEAISDAEYPHEVTILKGELGVLNLFRYVGCSLK